MLHGYSANFRVRLVILWRALMTDLDSHLRKAVIQFSLNVFYCFDVLELRTAAVDIANHLCCLIANKPNGEMKEVLDNRHSRIVSDYAKVCSCRKTIGTCPAHKIHETGHMSVVGNIQIVHDRQGLLILALDVSALMNLQWLPHRRDNTVIKSTTAMVD